MLIDVEVLEKQFLILQNRRSNITYPFWRLIFLFAVKSR